MRKRRKPLPEEWREVVEWFDLFRPGAHFGVWAVLLILIYIILKNLIK